MDVDAFGNIYAAVKQGNHKLEVSVPWASAIAYGTIIRVNASTHQVDWADWPGHITFNGYTYSTGDLRSITIAPNGTLLLLEQYHHLVIIHLGIFTKQFGTNDQGLVSLEFWITIITGFTYNLQ